jgi:predicted  nucleic acid-binding Zn-ribbon protein
MIGILSIMKEGEEQDNPTLFEIMKDDPHMTYNDATKVQEDTRLANEAKLAQEKEGVKKYKKGTEIDYHRYWKNMYEEEKKKRQEAQGETTIVKGIGMNSPEMKEAKHRVKELENSLSIALEINESHQRYNGKLQTRVTDLEEDNKKLAAQIEDQVERARKAGL